MTLCGYAALIASNQGHPASYLSLRFLRWLPLVCCISATTKHCRTITRNEYEEVRERTVVRMSQESSQTLFRRRSWMAETPFGTLKSVTGVRQFLLRGLEKVQTE